MKNKKRLDMAKKAISLIVSEIDDMYKGNAGEHSYCLQIKDGSDDSFIVQPRYDTAFYLYEDIVAIVSAFDLSSYLTIENNESGEPTPTIRVF